MIHGRCLCGDVEFEITGEITMIAHCHCSICRKVHGSAFATHGMVPTEGFRWVKGQDQIQHYESSPGGKRPFCRRCGSELPADPMPGTMFVPLGNLDEDPVARPIAHIFVGSKASWYDIPDQLPQFEAFPPGFDAPSIAEPARDAAPAGHVRGSCHCGRVAYDVDGPIGIRNCHCQRCRRARSAAHATNGFVDPARFRILRGEDELVSFKVPEAERFTQTFCRHCGSPMPRAFPNRPFVVIPMGSVEGDPGSRPTEHIFVGSKAPWFEIADALPQHPDYPPA